MENVQYSPEGQAQSQGGSSTKVIWRTFWILLIITLVELTIGMFVADRFPDKRIYFNILYIILTLAKAFYIVAEFMHLRHEIKNMIMTIVVPLLLFVWFIIAFLWDGNSYLELRERYDRPVYEKAEKKPHGESHGSEAAPNAVD